MYPSLLKGYFPKYIMILWTNLAEDAEPQSEVLSRGTP